MSVFRKSLALLLLAVIAGNTGIQYLQATDGTAVREVAVMSEESKRSIEWP